MQRLLPPSLFVLLLVAMILGSLAWPWPNLGSVGRVAGAIVVLGGLVLNLRHANMFATLDTTIRTFDDPGQLVRDGAFQWTRNPMYLGFSLMLAGVALFLGTAVAIAGPVMFVIIADQWYIPFEERRMAITFGADYDEYRSHVRRWVGRRSQR